MLFNVQISAPRHTISQESRRSDRQCILSVCSVSWSCFEDLSKLAFFSLSVKPWGRYQLFKKKAAGLLIGTRHLPYKEILPWLGHHSLQRWRLRTDLIHGSRGCWSELGFSTSHSSRPERGHFKVLQGTKQHRRSRPACLVRVLKYCNKPPSFRAYGSVRQYF